MMRRLVTILALVGTVSAFGQTKKDLIKYGDAAFDQRNFGLAATYYLKLLGASNIQSVERAYPYEVKPIVPPKKEVEDGATPANSTDSVPDTYENYAIHRAAACYRLLGNYMEAEIWYAKAINARHSKFHDAKLWYADALMKNEKVDAAKAQLEFFVDEYWNPGDSLYSLGQNLLISCELMSKIKDRSDIKIKKVDSTVNEGSGSFAVNYYGDENMVVFTSARDGGTIDEKSPLPSRYISDLYIATSEGTKIDPPKGFGQTVNTADHEGAGCLSIDRQTFYFTRWNVTNPSECNIHVCKFFNNQWMLPLKLNDYVNVEGFQSKDPHLSLDGSKLYFASNRPGGEGGFDIWYCEMDEFGNVQPAKNMGKAINTPGDEVSPYYHYLSQTLYFSSNGHVTMGGLDVVHSKYDEDDGTWSKPKNLGKPVNSSKDDQYFVINEKQSGGFFTSDREKCEDCNDEKYKEIAGNCFKAYSFDKNPMKFKLIGVVYNIETNEIIPNSLLTFKDIKGQKDNDFLMSDDKGAYEKELFVNDEWFIKAQKKGFFGDAATVNTMGVTESKTFVQDFFLTPIPEGELAIEGIEYDFDSPKLRPESKEALDKLLEILNINDNITVEIASHTDSRGSDAYNRRLSQGRAESVVNYLIANGISKDRLIPKGYGEDKPIEDCAKYPECPSPDDASRDCPCHQRNRRTAFTTISENELYNLKSE